MLHPFQTPVFPSRKILFWLFIVYYLLKNAVVNFIEKGNEFAFIVDTRRQ